MKRLLSAAVIGMLLASAPALAADSLYRQLGGYDAIAAVTDGFLKKLETDPGLSRFFVGHSVSSARRIRQLIVEFLCEKSGGPCFYTGRDMKEAHGGLKVTEKDWDESAKLLIAAMTELKVPKAQQDAVIAFVVTIEPDIVAK